MQEYRRAAHLLKDSQNSKAWFLRCYSLYLAGEKRKEEERIELSGRLGPTETTNKVCRLHRGGGGEGDGAPTDGSGIGKRCQ